VHSKGRIAFHPDQPSARRVVSSWCGPSRADYIAEHRAQHCRSGSAGVDRYRPTLDAAAARRIALASIAITVPRFTACFAARLTAAT
jgi:hypothetical protein